MATNGCVATREAVDELVEERGEVTCPLCDKPASAHQPEEPANITAPDVVAHATELMAQHPIAYTTLTADDWVMADRTEWCETCQAFQPMGHPAHGDPDARALMDLVDQRAADDAETGADGGEL